MPKQLAFYQDARLAIQKGVAKTARAVKSTLGPRGRHVMVDQGWGSPQVTKDGASVVDEIELIDPYENLGAQLIKEAASKTQEETGDGTTTTTLLTEAIFSEGLKLITAGADPMSIARGIKKAVDRLLEELKKLSHKVKTDDEIKQIATIAASNDETIGQIMAKAMKKVGRDGVITIEEGKGIETEVKIVEGMQFDRGFISPHFVTDQDRMEVVLNNPYILIHEEKLSNVMDLIPLMEKISAQKKPLLVIAEEVEGEALATLAVNKTKGILACAAVKAPGYGDRRKAMLEDIAVLTGAQPVFKDLGIDLKKVSMESLGRAKKVVIDSENTIIIEGAGQSSEIKKRVAKIRVEIEQSDSDYDKEKSQERLAKFAGGVAQVNVGAATETELKEKKNRAESALNAIKAAYEEGIVAGGGVTWLRLIKALDSLKLAGEEKAGITILQKVLEAPLRQLAENAGIDPSVVLRQVQKNAKTNFGYNVETGQFGDLLKEGIIDATKVLRCALQNSSSVATMLLISEAAVTDIPEKNKPAGPPMPGAPGMGGMPGMGGGMGMPGMDGGMGMPGMGGGMPMGGMGGMPGM